MAKTLAEIQQMITAKYDQREIINELADFLETFSPSPGGGGAQTILQSPDTTLWALGVNDSGALQTTQLVEGTPGTLHLFSPDNTEWNVTVTNEGVLVTTEV